MRFAAAAARKQKGNSQHTKQKNVFLMFHIYPSCPAATSTGFILLRLHWLQNRTPAAMTKKTLLPIIRTPLSLCPTSKLPND